MKKYLIPALVKAVVTRQLLCFYLMVLLVPVSVGDVGKQGIILKFNVISQSAVRENIPADMHILYKCCVVKDVQQIASFSA